jgi:hypothetical protein
LCAIDGSRKARQGIHLRHGRRSSTRGALAGLCTH